MTLPADPGGRSRRKPEEPPLHQVYRELERWITARLSRKEGDPPLLEVELRLRIRPGRHGAPQREGRDEFVRDLERQLELIRERIDLEQLGFHSGHVFCHWCSSPNCVHSQPESPRSVFVGYDPTGKPRWRDFTSWVVELHDDRVDRIIGDAPLPLAISTSGKELVSDLLADFGRRRSPYHIVAQLACGPFTIPDHRAHVKRSFALTAHLVERRLPGGDPAYELNLIARPPEGHHFPTLVAERVVPVLTEFVNTLRSEVRKLASELSHSRSHGRRVSISQARERGRVLFARMPGQLEKMLRRRGRRTRHAQHRTRDPGRPTASALSDALNAGAEQLFLDRSEDTVIVRGPRNRIHVFRRDGTHITSIVYPGETIRDRQRSGRWSPLDAESVQELRAGIARKGQITPEGSSELPGRA